MKTFAIVLLALCGLGIVVCFYFLHRNNRVASFLLNTSHLAFESGDAKLIEWAIGLNVEYMYDRIFYSIRPINYDNFFPEWVAKRLNELENKI